MNSTLSKHLALLTLPVIGILSAGVPSAWADDTEIFLAVPPDTVETRPNILFIMDTSGSMATNVVTQVTYNPATTYAGNCPAGRIYWSTGTGTPNCATSTNWVSEAQFVCRSAQSALATNGLKTQGPVAQWNGSNANVSKRKWEALAGNRDYLVECREDEAIPHGDGTVTGLYAANASNGPFTNNSSQKITWTSPADRSYTFFTSNWINYKRNASTVTRTRLQIMQDVAKSTLAGLSEVNVGLMRYSTTGEGGMVVYPVTPIETARTGIADEIDKFTASGSTPLTETLYEAYLYWAGEKVLYGNSSSPVKSVNASRLVGDTTKYQSPLGQECQKNFIVYLTDGEPNGDKGAGGAPGPSRIEKLPGFANLTGSGTCLEDGVDGTSDGALGDGRCLSDLAKYMQKKDFVDDKSADDALEPKENITTYTIGFGNGVSAQAIKMLEDAGTAGGGAYFPATDTAELTEVFESIIRKILDDNVSFTAPTVSVNAFNRTQNLNDLFITVFGPSDLYHWPGNLKKYRLDETGVIEDADGVPAVDESKGFFKDTSRSYWSTVADGPDVESGGAAHQLPTYLSRNVYTDIAAYGASPVKSLTALENNLSTLNSLIDGEDLGWPDAASAALNRDDTINWVRGLDVDDEDGDGNKAERRFVIGDPLHSRPVSVIYGGTVASPDLDDALVFVGTNDGYLHAIDPKTGEELWSFVPSEFLQRMKDLRENRSSDVKRYALDGSIRAHKVDKNGNGIVDPVDDHVYLFFGLGRGGSNYYALDITDKNSPKLLWRHGASDTLIGLGQSWSTPVVTRVNIKDEPVNSNNPDQLVIIVGGGYDPTQDAVPYNTDDTGNRIFMIDAINGNVVWHAGPSSGFGFDSTANFKHAKLNNSIPADVRVLDLNNDGFADRMYAADTGGRVWRFDVLNNENRIDLVRGGVFASLGNADESSHPVVSARRFYYAPDVSMLRAGGRVFLNIAIGSGYRGHPLNTEIHDSFYSLRDFKTFVPMTIPEYTAMDSAPITDGDSRIVDVTTNASPTIAPGGLGWKIDLNAPSWLGEKVLAEARTFGGSILFTTFIPTKNLSVTSCTAKTGTNALYVVKALDGSPVVDRDRDATTAPVVADRRSGLDQHGIAPEAIVLFPSPDDPKNCEGKECSPPPVCLVGVEKCGVDFTNTPVRTFWSQQDVDAN